MERKFYWFFLFIILTSCENVNDAKNKNNSNSSESVPDAKNVSWHDTLVVFDWNGDNKPDSFYLRSTPDHHGGYCQITIKVSGQKPLIICENDSDPSFNKLDTLWVYDYVLKHNLIKSNSMAFIKMGTNGNAQTVLFLCGWAFASDPPKQYLIALNKTGAPKVVFATETNELSFYENKTKKCIELETDSPGYIDLPSDIKYDTSVNGAIPNGMPKIIKNKSNGIIASYAPIYVLELNKDIRLQIDTTETINATKESNFGIWAGFRARKDSVILRLSDKEQALFISVKKAKSIWSNTY